MKKRIIAILLIFTPLVLSAVENIKFNLETYELAHSERNDKQSVKEYILPGESLEKWSRLIAVREFYEVNSPEEYIKRLGALYQKQMPHMKFAMFSNEDKSQWVIDYIMYSDDILEWNYFQARKRNTGNGIIVHQFAERKYGGDHDSWDLASERNRLLPLLLEAKFQTSKN